MSRGEISARMQSLSAELGELVRNVGCIGREQCMQEVVAELGKLVEVPVLTVQEEESGGGAGEDGVRAEGGTVHPRRAKDDVLRVTVRVLSDEGEDRREGGSNGGEDDTVQVSLHSCVCLYLFNTHSSFSLSAATRKLSRIRATILT